MAWTEVEDERAKRLFVREMKMSSVPMFKGQRWGKFEVLKDSPTGDFMVYVKETVSFGVAYRWVEKAYVVPKEWD